MVAGDWGPEPQRDRRKPARRKFALIGLLSACVTEFCMFVIGRVAAKGQFNSVSAVNASGYARNVSARIRNVWYINLSAIQVAPVGITS